MRDRSRFSLNLNHRGMALVTVLLVMLVLTILTTGVVVIAVSNYRQSSTTVDHNEAYYVAEAGVNYKVKEFESLVASKLPDSTSNQIILAIETWTKKVDEPMTLSTVGNQDRKFQASAIITNKNFIDITSVGTVGNVSRTLIKRIRMPGLIIDKAILTQGTLGINATDVILSSDGTYGPVQTLSNTANSVNINTQGQVSKVYIPNPAPLTIKDVIPNCTIVATSPKNICQTGAYQYEVIFDDNLSKLPPVPPIVTPTVSTLLSPYKIKTVPIVSDSLSARPGTFILSPASMDANSTYVFASTNGLNTVFRVPEFRIDGTDGTYSVDIGNNNIIIVADSMYLGGEFKIIGSGTLSVFVNFNNLTLACKNKTCGVKGNPVNGVAKPNVADQFILNVTGLSNQKLDFTSGQNQSSFYMSLMTDMAIDITLYGNGNFYGFIATSSSNITLNGSGNSDPKSSCLIYAPNAAITVNGSISMEGALIANSYNSNGQAIMKFNFDYTNPPFAFLNPFANFEYYQTLEK